MKFVGGYVGWEVISDVRFSKGMGLSQ
jgi:hypothetical protein